MHRLAAIFVVVWFLALGSGLVGRAHDRQHAREDAVRAAVAQGKGAPKPVEHNDTNCFFHAQLHMPAVSAGWVPVLICLGLWIAFVTQLASSLVSCHVPARLDCRGPPAC
jgi:hypothetical protein